MRKIRNKSIELFSRLQSNKRGQAILEYSIIFVVVGLGVSISLTLLQAKLGYGIATQAIQLEVAGRSLF